MSYDMEDDEPSFFTRQQEQKQRAGEYGPNPFAHAYRPSSMEGCLDCCEACRWEKEQHFAMRERFGYPPAAVTLTDGDRKFLKAARISWEDTRA